MSSSPWERSDLRAAVAGRKVFEKKSFQRHFGRNNGALTLSLSSTNLRCMGLPISGGPSLPPSPDVV